METLENIVVWILDHILPGTKPAEDISATEEWHHDDIE